MFDREYFEKNEFVKKIYSFENLQCIEAVSYTHLTLPTIRLV